MRIFSLVGLLLTVLIIGWLAATMFRSTTGGPVVPSGSGAGGTGIANTTTAPIERAQELASQDQVRQNMILDLEGKL